MILTKKEDIIMNIIRITMIEKGIIIEIIKIMNQNHILLIVQIKKLITMLELRMKKVIQNMLIIITMTRINFIQLGKNRDGDEFGPKKFYGKIRTENTERENRPKKIMKI